MANYGLQYISEFDSVVNERYRVEIYGKNYSGAVSSMVMSTPPATLSCTTDDPKAAIKGQALELRIFNNGSLPITNFYSDDDTFFRVNFIWKQLLNVNITTPVSAIGGVISIFGYDFTSILPSVKSIFIGGNTYTIVSTSVSGINAFVFNTASTYSKSFTSTNFTINYEINTTQFTGFINQDDSSEILVDYGHEIVLTCNDGLALLQNTTFNYLPPDITGIDIISRYEPTTVQPLAGNTIRFTNTNYQGGGNGDSFTLTGTTIDGNYTIVQTDFIGTNIDIEVVQTITIGAASNGLVYVQTNIDFAGKNSIASIIQVCLYQTGLSLNTNLFFNIYETTFKQGQSPLYQTYIDCNMFVNDDGSFNSCYEILTACMLNTMTLVQAKGEWWCIRWDEIRYSSSDIFKYDINGLLISITPGGLNETFNIGVGHPPLNGILREIKRPYQYVKRTFNYVQPKSLTKNLDLQSLGPLLRQYTQGAGINLTTTYEYTALYIQNGFFFTSIKEFNTNTFYIRIIKDYIGRELDRFLVVIGDGVIAGGGAGDNPTLAAFLPVDITTGDIVTWSFSMKTGNIESGHTVVYDVNLINGGFHQTFMSNFVAGIYPTDKSEWIGTRNLIDQFAGVTDMSQWQQVSFNESLPAPKNGQMYLFLAQGSDLGGSAKETHYKDFKLAVTHAINSSLNITGQVHDTSQVNVIKNNEDISINLDDSPSNVIAGTLFCSYYNLDSGATVRTQTWYRSGFTEQRRLNDILTFEELFYKRTARPELDGTFFGVTDNGQHVSIMSIIFPNFLPDYGINVIGQMSIDYRANECKATFYELYKLDDPDSNLTSTYAFTYIYSTS